MMNKLFQYDENIRVDEEHSITGTMKVVLTNIATEYRAFCYEKRLSPHNKGNSTRDAKDSLAQEYIMENNLSELKEFKLTNY